MRAEAEVPANAHQLKVVWVKPSGQLEVHVWEAADQLRVDFVGSIDLFDAATMRRMLGHYERLLEVVREPFSLPGLPLVAAQLVAARRRQRVVQQHGVADGLRVP